MPTFFKIQNNVNFSDEFLSIGKQTVNILQGVRSIQRIFGESGPCDKAKLKEAAEQVEEKAKENLEKTVEETVAKTFGFGFIRTFLAAVAQSVGQAATKIADAFITQAVGGFIVGNILAAVSVILAAIPGFEIYMQYLMVKTLVKNLAERRNVAGFIYSKVSTLLNLIEAYLDNYSGEDNDKYSSIERALRYAIAAKKKIDKEGRRNGQGFAINIEQLRSAEQLLDLASETLLIFPQRFNKNLYNLKQVHLRYGLTTTVPQYKAQGENIGFQKKDWEDYFNNISDEIAEKYDPEKADSQVRKDLAIETRKNLINLIIPLLPNEFRLLYMQIVFNQLSTPLLDAFPVAASQIPGLNDLRDLLANTAKKLVKTFYGYQVNGSDRYPYPYTLLTTSTNITYFENAIQSFPKMWSMVKRISSLYTTFLIEASKELERIITELETENQLRESSEADLLSKKVRWSQEFIAIKGILYPATNTITGIPSTSGRPINPNEIQDLIEKAGPKIDILKEFIRKKRYRSDGAENINKAEVLFEYAQIALIPLLADALVLTSEKTVSKLRSDLQVVKKLSKDIIKEDNLELIPANDYINTIETHSTYPRLKSLYEGALNSFQQTPYSDISTWLASGDVARVLTLGTIVSEGYRTLEELNKCKDSSDPGRNDSGYFNLGLQIGEFLTIKKFPFEVTMPEGLGTFIQDVQQEVTEYYIGAKDIVKKSQNLVNRVNSWIRAEQERTELELEEVVNNTIPSTTSKRPAFDQLYRELGSIENLGLLYTERDQREIQDVL